MRKVVENEEMVDCYVEMGAVPPLLATVEKLLETNVEVKEQYTEAILGFVNSERGRAALLEHGVEPILKAIASGMVT